MNGVPAASDLDPAAAAWFAGRSDDPCRTLLIGTVTVAVADAATAAALSAPPLIHARVVPILAGGGGSGGWQVVGESVRRLEAVSAQSGSVQTTVLLDLPAPGLAFTPSALTVQVYLIQGQSVHMLGLGDGFLFPAADQAAAFRWCGPGLRERGSQDGCGCSAAERASPRSRRRTPARWRATSGRGCSCTTSPTGPGATSARAASSRTIPASPIRCSWMAS